MRDSIQVTPPNPSTPRTRRPTPNRRDQVRSEWGWLADPRNAVLLLLGLVLGIGGTRRWLRTLRARQAVARLEEGVAGPGEIFDASRHGRAAIRPLFTTLTDAQDPSHREAAGQALSRIWANDDLIAEEEQGLVRRGFDVRWRARRAYPRDLQTPFHLAVEYGVPFLRTDGTGVGPHQLEWSHRLSGAGRAGLEVFSDWEPGDGRVEFQIRPDDFPSMGPHRLVLHTRVRTTHGLSSTWQIDLPQIPFAFEFDPRLQVDALFGLPEDARAEEFARAVRLVPAPDEGGPPELVPLVDELVLREPPRLRVVAPLPSDLAHRIEMEFEGVPGRHPAGSFVVPSGAESPLSVPLSPSAPLPPSSLERPGTHRVRAHLIPDAGLGWANPSIRSVWPFPMTTDWTEAIVLRR